MSSNARFLLHPVSRCLKWKQSPAVRWWSGDQTEELEISLDLSVCQGHGNKYTSPKHWRGPLSELGKIKGTSFQWQLSNTQHFVFLTCSQPSLTPCCSPVSWGRTHCCPCPLPSPCHPHWNVLIGAYCCWVFPAVATDTLIDKLPAVRRSFHEVFFFFRTF